MQDPIAGGVKARGHTAVYTMHRYFARRPHNVFAELVEHYSAPGDIVLDPFFGGGVTLVEALKLNRKAIGFDINPVATFVTRMELTPVDLAAFRQSYRDILEEYEDIARSLFRTSCRTCSSSVPALWFEYSSETDCPECSTTFLVANANKKKAGTWRCPTCQEAVKFSPQVDTNDVLVNIYYECPCGDERMASPTQADRRLVGEVREELLVAEKEDNLWLPDADIPECNMVKESALFKKGITKFRHFFTPRHLLALGRLKELIVIKERPLQDWLLFAFSSTLRYTNRMVTHNEAWRGKRPFEWSRAGFWLPAIHLEANVGVEFRRRCEAIVRGKRKVQERFPDQVHEYDSVGELFKVDEGGSIGYYLETRSSTDLPLSRETVDVVVTDPPYGSYVHYADLTNFWSVWLPEIGGLGDVIDDEEEAVVARKDFPGAKNTKDYQELLTRCFKESHRVLKKPGYLVMTFHNREPRAWGALLLAAAEAGFHLSEDGIVYQEGVPEYKHTSQSRRGGSIRGDFILSFQTERGEGGVVDHWADDEHLLREEDVVTMMKRIITEESGPVESERLFAELYRRLVPVLLERAHSATAAGSEATSRFLDALDAITIINSERPERARDHFHVKDGMWSLRAAEVS